MRNLASVAIIGCLMVPGMMECMSKSTSKYTKNWVLSKYKSVNDPRIQKDADEILKRVQNFEEKYMKCLSVENLKNAIVEYNDIYATMSEMYSYFGLSFKLNQKNNEISNACQKMTELYSKCNDPARPRRRFPTSMAVLIAITPGSSWARAKKSEISSDVYAIQSEDGKTLTLSDVVEKANNGETEGIRAAASKALSEGLKKNEYALVSVFNNIALEHKVFRGIRKYTTPEEPRYFADDISQEAVNNMLDAVTERYKKICHRYYKLKARILGKKKLQYWDRCSQVKLTKGTEKKYTYEEALKIVFDVYKNFSERFYEIIEELAISSHVDVYPKEGKVSGAFAWSMPNEKPYVMLNFYGSTRDITTIAHEFGHAIHMTLSLRNKYLVSHPPLNISETASTFGEKLTNEYLINAEKDPKRKIELICDRLDDVMGTVFRQTAFLKFERRIHEIRKDKELTAEELNAEWRKVLEESLGDGVEIDHCVDNYWGYITHFTDRPFYVYSYSFGALFVEGLYAEYKRTGKDFVAKYEEALASGGTKTYAEIAQMFGIDANSRKFWGSALKSIEGEIDELEKLCDSALHN